MGRDSKVRSASSRGAAKKAQRSSAEEGKVSARRAGIANKAEARVA